MSVWWSVGLAATSLGTSWLIGNHRKVGWLLGVYLQVGWLVYAVVTTQWGFIASALAFGFMNVRNYLKWRNDERVALARVEEVSGADPSRLDARPLRVRDG